MMTEPLSATIARCLTSEGADRLLHYGSGAAEAEALAAELRAPRQPPCMSAWIHGDGGKETPAQNQALKGIGQPEQVAGVVAFLAGPDGGWTTGQVVDVSGGTKR